MSRPRGHRQRLDSPELPHHLIRPAPDPVPLDRPQEARNSRGHNDGESHNDQDDLQGGEPSPPRPSPRGDSGLTAKYCVSQIQ